MEQGHDWLVFVLIFVGVLYVGGPLGTYLKLRQSVDPNPIRLDTTRTPLPVAVGNYFDKVEGALRSIGFEPVHDLALPGHMANVAANLRLFVNRENQDSASCTAVYLKAGSTWKMKVQYVQFVTFFRDETVYLTTNSGVLSSFPAHPSCTTTDFPTCETRCVFTKSIRALFATNRRCKKRRCRFSISFRATAPPTNAGRSNAKWKTPRMPAAFFWTRQDTCIVLRCSGPLA